MTHKLSLAWLTVQGCPPLEHVRVAAAAGYDMAGLRLIAPHGLDLAHPIVGNPVLIREIRTLAEDLGVGFLDGEVFTLLPETDVSALTPVLDTAAELGMTIMQVTCEDPDAARAAENLARLADHAAGHGIDMAIEFMRWRAVATIEDAAALAAASGRDNVGILLDALHLFRSGGTLAGVAAARDKLLYLQLCDAAAERPADDAGLIAEARGARMFPGDGALPLADLMRLLPGDMPISVETPHAGDAGLDHAERAARGMAAARRFLAVAA